MIAAPLLLLLACAADGDAPGVADSARLFAEVVARVRQDPGRTRADCPRVSEPSLATACIQLGAELMAQRDPEGAAGACGALPDEADKDECLFQVAERSRQPSRCAAAGRFADDCRLHLWSQGLSRWVPRGAGPGEVEDAAGPALVEHGFEEGDMRPWSALYRYVLAGQRPLDRRTCDAAGRPELAQACRNTGLALYNDLLNNARDRGLFPCDGGELPSLLQYAPDPEIDAAIEERKGVDLCP